jgi:hypothetical protein
MVTQTANKKILFICYSLSGQTSSLLARLAKGLESTGVSVTTERLHPVKQIHFPFSSIWSTFIMMMSTFFRRRIPIKPLSDKCTGRYDLIIIAGPTWSYNPSGPILSLFDRDGEKLFKGQTVIPFISCRGYWRMHWFGLKSLLKKCNAKTPSRIIFTHPSKEPWRTLGVFLKLAGKSPEHSTFLAKRYPRYGHSKKQHEESFRFGTMLGDAIQKGVAVEKLNFSTSASGCN